MPPRNDLFLPYLQSLYGPQLAARKAFTGSNMELPEYAMKRGMDSTPGKAKAATAATPKWLPAANFALTAASTGMEGFNAWSGYKQSKEARKQAGKEQAASEQAQVMGSLAQLLGGLLLQRQMYKGAGRIMDAYGRTQQPYNYTPYHSTNALQGMMP